MRISLLFALAAMVLAIYGAHAQQAQIVRPGAITQSIS